MAEICLGLATTHVAMLVRTPNVGDPQQVGRFRAGYERLARALQDARPDAAIILSSDHVNKFFLDNMPAFCIGLFNSFTGPAEENVGIPYRTVPSALDLSAHLLKRGLDDGVDFARAEAWEVDHGFMVPLHLLDPEARIPIVPIHINCAAPPYPALHRCYALGEWLRRAIEGWPPRKRIAIIAAGGLSHSPGDAKMGDIDEAFDRRFLALMEAGSREGMLALRDEEVEATGSSTAEIRTWIALAGAFSGRRAERVLYEPIAGFGTGCAQVLVPV